MRKWIAWMLLMALLSGGALAENLTKQSVIDSLGVCSVDAYAGKRVEYFDYVMDYEVAQSVNSGKGLLTWDVVWDVKGEGEISPAQVGNCFPVQGMIAGVDYDLDGDGQDEWIVLHNSGESERALWLRIYECDGEYLTLAKEACLSEWFTVYPLYQTTFLARVKGEARLVFQNGIYVDGPGMNVYVLKYKDGEISLDRHAGWFRDETGALHIEQTDAEGSEEENVYSEAELQTGVKSLNRILAGMGFDWEDFPFCGSPDFMRRALSMPEQKVLHVFDFRGQRDDQGRPVARLQFTAPGNLAVTTGSVNLRLQPGLDGEKWTAVSAGMYLLYRGEQHTDERGVVWYGVEHEGQPCWVSSKYASLR